MKSLKSYAEIHSRKPVVPYCLTPTKEEKRQKPFHQRRASAASTQSGVNLRLITQSQAKVIPACTAAQFV